MKCYTIGYGNRQVNDFIDILIENKVTYLVDIRRYPQSTFKDYDKESLESILPKNGIIYSHFEAVGGMRDSTYAEYMETDSFKNSFEKLMELIRKVTKECGRVILMCAEKSPKSCHRQHLSIKLEENGVEVVHLVERGQTSLLNF